MKDNIEIALEASSTYRQIIMKIKYLSAPVLALTLLLSCQKDENATTTYSVKEDASKVEWKGSATDHFHVGSFGVKGDLKTDGKGVLSAGDFRIPIASIKNYDLPEGPREELLDHLKSPDFFNLALHPEASFHITSVKPYNGGTPSAVEGANYEVTGDFSMIGQTHQISFPAKITNDEAGLHTHAFLKINRLNWGMTSYNDPAQALYILPEVEIILSINAVKD
ncbi:YceI family protein [Desertivirga arenae]|uniref:YceI family protein n=1 Tax=Desertivirga arenae TaxID=2810309 RepID=UPI001A9764C3|nr:YceI family protein [Pedobacter sp. SYSU D00823]